jgi:hypothetical protein
MLRARHHEAKLLVVPMGSEDGPRQWKQQWLPELQLGSAMAWPRSARVCGGNGSGEAMRVRRRKELGLVTLVLHHAEGGTDTWQRGGRAASMEETHGA